MSMVAKGTLRGKKTNSNHTTLSPLAQEVVNAVKTSDRVKKVFPGPFKNINGSGKKSIKISIYNVDGTLKIRCRDSGFVQLIFVHTQDRFAVHERLALHFARSPDVDLVTE